MALWVGVTCAYFIGVHGLTKVFLLLVSIVTRLSSLLERMTAWCDGRLNSSLEVRVGKACWVENLSWIQDPVRVKEFLDAPLQVPNPLTKFIHHPLTLE